MWCFHVVRFIILGLSYIHAEAGIEVHVRFPKWPLLHVVQWEKGQQGIWSLISVCGVHNGRGEEREVGWPVQCQGCWPWCFLVLLGGRHLQDKDVKTALFLNCVRKNWHPSVTVHWKSQISDTIPVLLFKRTFLNHPSIPQTKLHWSTQNSVNLLDLIIFL